MNKFKNKKGFTLIEMLVVIAIIAILVAIIVPTVTNSTRKAAYATDAANLRSSLAEAEILYLNNLGPDGTTAITAGSAVDYSDIADWTPKGTYTGLTGGVVISVDASGAWTATLNTKTIANIATGAETGTLG